MRAIATIKQRHYALTAEQHEQQRQVTLDDAIHTIDWRRIAALVGDEQEGISNGGHYNLIIEGRSYEIYARRLAKPEGKEGRTYAIQLAGQYFEVTIEDERTRLLTGITHAGAASNVAKISAPMPGLVLQVPLEAGSEVTDGQTIVVLEAMKMENDLTSPIAGTIKEVRVSPGQTVEQGQLLAIIEGEQ